MKLAVFFPGIGYHCDKPLLYYAKKLAVEKGYDEIIALDYTMENKQNIRGNREKMTEAFETLYEQAQRKLEGIDFDAYDEVLFVGKSVGTVIASALAEKYKIRCRKILYTPVEATFEFGQEDAVAFIGSKDPWSDVDEVVREAGLKKVPMEVYEGVNHSLEGADTLRNLEILVDVMEKTGEFMDIR